MRYVIGFGKFWYDFMVGDSVILAIGGIGVLVVGAALVRTSMASTAEIVLPAIVVLTLAGSLMDRR